MTGFGDRFSDDNNTFAFAMYGQLRPGRKNLFFSSFSLRTVLSMVRAGAMGETARQIGDALRLSSSEEAPAVFAQIIDRLHAGGGGKYEMSVANSLWCQDGMPLQPPFVDRITKSYGTGVNLLDFRRAAGTAREIINRWVEEHTKEKIRELIPPGGLSAARLVLVNAIYFKGIWALPFPKTATRTESFRVEGGGTVLVPLMYLNERVRYLQAAGYQAIELLYQGEDLSMLILLPDREDRLPDLENRLSPGMLHDSLARMDTREVKVFLPRFTITWGTVDMSDALKALGIRAAFDPHTADFSGINGIQPPADGSLFISAIFHKAFVDVNEQGTEAAAATAARMFSAMAMRPPSVPIFRADHPFLFAILDRTTGTVLFLGRVADPSSN